MSNFARRARLSVELLETRETPAGSVLNYNFYTSGAASPSDPAQVQLTAPDSSTAATVTRGQMAAFLVRGFGV